jgi:deoxyribonuclease (pyrimidine dimer)|tara:strand:+ start:683 stop:1105 length:423 start_codon:yes stop_codon:yes gene_type:complete
MTRINIIPVSELHDQHLIAEYREITMVPAALKRTLNSKVGLLKEKISKHFTLNSGHVYFFYDKGLYLDKRYTEIVNEMKSRGFNPDSTRVFPIQIFKDNNLYNDWTPMIEEQKLIRQRIQERINSKPDWYRKTRRQENVL